MEKVYDGDGEEIAIEMVLWKSEEIFNTLKRRVGWVGD